MIQLTGTFTDTAQDPYYFRIGMPEKLAFADSDNTTITVYVENAGDNTPCAHIPFKISLVCDGDDLVYGETMISDWGGKVTFDISRFLQIFMRGGYDAELTPTPETDSVFDYTQASKMIESRKVLVNFYYNGNNHITTQQYFYMQNGADFLLDRYWSSPTYLRWWQGLPFTFDFPNTKNAMLTRRYSGGNAISYINNFPAVATTHEYTRIRINADQLGLPTATQYILQSTAGVNKGIDPLDQQKGYKFGIATSGDTGHIEGTNLLSETSVKVVINVEDCTEGVYLRWLGKHNEMFYWLFTEHSEIDTYKAKDYARAGVYDNIVDNGVIKDGTLRTLTKESTLKVFSRSLNGFDWQVVSQMFDAPFVDMLVEGDANNPQSVIWQRMHIKPASVTIKKIHADDYTYNRVVSFTIEKPKEALIHE